MIRLYAAGSLKGALADVTKAYEAAGGERVDATFGPSGLLKDEIAGGAKADVFASANMAHAQALHEARLSGPATCFARNRLCALVRPGLAADGESLLERMLEPRVKLGTSTPKADPSGDYAFEVFAKAEKIKPGARDALEAKTLKLTGGKDSPAPPANGDVYGWHIAEGRADIFLTYRTNALAARQHYPEQRMVELPEALAVAADYGLTVINGARVAAQAFADFILSPKGLNILAGYGFSPA
jgi:ABC-type molybdate transport system substrate-binding protein